MKRRTKLLLSLALVVCALGYLVSQSIGDQVVYSKYVDELVAERAEYAGRPVRVEGIVEEGTIERRPDSLDYRFVIGRRGRTLTVRYTGVVPDTFREGAGVTVRGRLARDGDFHADEVIAKCPSKYEMQDREPTADN